MYLGITLPISLFCKPGSTHAPPRYAIAIDLTHFPPSPIDIVVLQARWLARSLPPPWYTITIDLTHCPPPPTDIAVLGYEWLGGCGYLARNI